MTEDLAISQAKKADAEIAAGKYRGPLHGIPYGIKDLFAVEGTHTTWGTPPYKNQVIHRTAFVAKQLQEAGAVLVAKLSLGELAEDDVWFGGLTRNPWDTTKGSGVHPQVLPLQRLRDWFPLRSEQKLMDLSWILRCDVA